MAAGGAHGRFRKDKKAFEGDVTPTGTTGPIAALRQPFEGLLNLGQPYRLPLPQTLGDSLILEGVNPRYPAHRGLIESHRFESLIRYGHALEELFQLPLQLIPEFCELGFCQVSHDPAFMRGPVQGDGSHRGKISNRRGPGTSLPIPAKVRHAFAEKALGILQEAMRMRTQDREKPGSSARGRQLIRQERSPQGAAEQVRRSLQRGPGVEGVPPWLVDFCEGSQNVLIRRTNSIIHLHMLPSHNAILVDNVGRGMSYLSTPGVVGVEETITVDDLVPGIGEEWEARGLAIFRDRIHHPLQIFRAIHREGDELGVLLLILGQQSFQLHELAGTVASPVSSVEDQDHVLDSPEGGEGKGVPPDGL